MNWTKEKPTKPGWYWHIHTAPVDIDRIEIVQVVRSSNELTGESWLDAIFNDTGPAFLEHLSGDY
jgi:hypothetical protein